MLKFNNIIQMVFIGFTFLNCAKSEIRFIDTDPEYFTVYDNDEVIMYINPNAKFYWSIRELRNSCLI